jgi:hypothetical protein
MDVVFEQQIDAVAGPAWINNTIHVTFRKRLGRAKRIHVIRLE